jgi:hypothetical protein
LTKSKSMSRPVSTDNQEMMNIQSGLRMTSFYKKHSATFLSCRPSTLDGNVNGILWNCGGLKNMQPRRCFSDSTYNRDNCNPRDNKNINKEQQTHHDGDGTTEEATNHRQQRTKQPKSPYSILQVKTSATIDEIKASFRRLAKQYHPDLNPTPTLDQNNNNRTGAEIMAELIDAYNLLLGGDDFVLGSGSRVGDSRVSLACEIYTLQELRELPHNSRHFQVHAIRLLYHNDDDDVEDESCDELIRKSTLTSTSFIPSKERILQAEAHPDDSVADLKRWIQNIKTNNTPQQVDVDIMEEWGLKGRRRDRDQLATGWELVQQVKRRHAHDDDDGHDDDNHNHKKTATNTNTVVLGTHFFLHSYGLKHNDIIYAVVATNE